MRNFATSLKIPGQARRGRETRAEGWQEDGAEAAEEKAVRRKAELKKNSLLTFPFYSPTIQTWL
jgi:hypothetical protein